MKNLLFHITAIGQADDAVLVSTDLQKLKLTIEALIAHHV